MTSKSQITKISGCLSDEGSARPGSELLSMLLRHANTLGDTVSEMERQLNVKSYYFARLRSGNSSTTKITGRFAEACALYLGVPRLMVLIAAGQVKPQDCDDDPFEVISALPRAITYIQNHPKYGPLMPIGLIGESLRLKYLIVLLFENATNMRLLPSRLTEQKLTEQTRGFQERREAQIANIEQVNEEDQLRLANKKANVKK